MKQQKQKSKLQGIITIVLLLFLFYMMYSVMYSKGNYGEKIDPSEVITKIEAGEVEKWHAYNGICKIKLKKDSKATEFPTTADFYCEYTSLSIQKILDATNGYNATAKDEDKIKWDNPPIRESLLESLLPYASIILLAVFAFMIFKSIGKSNQGAMSFGRSRARSGENIKVRFKDVAGADEEKAELEEIVQFLKDPKKFTALGARIPKGVLLVGQPGTGKTLLAKAVAGESNVPFLSISGSDFVEMFVGVGASRVRDLFEQAKRNKPCIIFIDEIDAVGRQRGTGLGGGNDEREQTLNQLLVEMDGFEANEGIIVLAATNRSDVLDPALLRPGRFDRQIYVHVPDVKGRESIIKIHAQNKPLDSDIDFNTLARITSGFTGADLENMLNEAAILAARADRPKIIMEDLTEGINKVIMGPQKKSWLITEKDKKITAYHESGHAIIGRLLEHCDDVQEVSIIPRGMAAGYTMSRPNEDESHMTFNRLNDQICMIMGGRIAEEIIFKDISTGAQNDIQKATQLARKMITEWGMSSKLGFMCFDTGNEPFLGRDYQSKSSRHSEKIAGVIDEEIMKILETNYARATKILSDNKELLDKMSNLLLIKETIYKEEVDMLVEGKSVEEVMKHIEDKLAERTKRQEIDKKEIELSNKLKEYEAKVKTAEVLVKTGVISPQEFEKIKKARDDIKQEFNTFLANKIIDDASKIEQSNNIEGAEEKEEKTNGAEEKTKKSTTKKKTTTTKSSEPKEKKTSLKTTKSKTEKVEGEKKSTKTATTKKTKKVEDTNVESPETKSESDTENSDK